MRPLSVFWACLTAAAFAFFIGVVMGTFTATNRSSQAEHQHPPPAGDQFDEGPTLVRAPSTDLAPARYIF